jgi:hypothetical protein
VLPRVFSISIPARSGRSRRGVPANRAPARMPAGRRPDTARGPCPGSVRIAVPTSARRHA